MRYIILFSVFVLLRTSFATDHVAQPRPETKLSPATKTCIGCHSNFTPGIVQDWMTSRHANTIPSGALEKPLLERRISTESLPDNLMKYAVGCYECHSLNIEGHDDSFDHMGRRIHVIVSPNDCGTCHPKEKIQFSGSKKSAAHRNLMGNQLYLSLVSATTGLKKIDGDALTTLPPSEATLHETCLGCHGTKIVVKGTKTLETGIGPVTVPALTNWPNQGIGRVNPDGSTGTCTACHTRHGFLIEVARKPYTCSQCHHEPDVPAWDVYEESKHGNIYASQGYSWDFKAVPWVAGMDFKAPTCASCHNSLLVSPTGDIIAERTHDFGSRLWVRLFGLIYSVPQPKTGDTTLIKNKDGLPLPSAFDGTPAQEYLIDAAEQKTREDAMSRVCNTCHSRDWIQGHFAKLSHTVHETNLMTKAATDLMTSAWGEGVEDNRNPFDETIEIMWIRQWLFYSNSIRYASAMTGAPDYATFKNGWWYLTENIQHMKDWIDLKYNKKEKEED
jgi:hypothetical protein